MGFPTKSDKQLNDFGSPIFQNPPNTSLKQYSTISQFPPPLESALTMRIGSAIMAGYPPWWAGWLAILCSIEAVRVRPQKVKNCLSNPDVL